jgi:hypothetical protein
MRHDGGDVVTIVAVVLPSVCNARAVPTVETL